MAETTSMKKKATGRPRKKFKSDQMIVKLSPAKKASYERAADASEMSLSEWVRSILDAALRRSGASGDESSQPVE